MTKKKIAREKRDWTANWRLLPGLTCLVLLAGCGGGGSGSDMAMAQDATKQIAAAVPGSWTGRVPGSEVINGITVPPEPSLTLNNATLAGVDANKNGVRDDVERILATRSVNAESNTKLKLMAQHFQNVIISPRPISRVEAISYERKYSCALDMPGIVPKELSHTQGQMLSQIMANTESRKIALGEYYRALGYSVDSRETYCAK